MSIITLNPNMSCIKMDMFFMMFAPRADKMKDAEKNNKAGSWITLAGFAIRLSGLRLEFDRHTMDVRRRTPVRQGYDQRAVRLFERNFADA